MRFEFRKKRETSQFLLGDGQLVKRDTEVRFDPLTGESSRVVFDPGLTFSIPAYRDVARQTSGKNCPFCPENVWQQTPLFPNDLVEGGRITHGEAIVAPNLFPYSKHNGVVIMSKAHFVRLEDFTTDLIKHALIAAQKYAMNVLKHETDASFVSINWNYLPPSGGSMLHSHLHVVISESPTNEQRMMTQHHQLFKERYDQHYFDWLYDYEKRENERWIGESGDIAWMHAFAPKSHNDFLAVFRNRRTIDDVTETDWRHFAEGLINIFSTLTEQNLASFNLALSFTHDGSPAYARLVPRLTLGQLGTSDMNFFHTLHDEPLSYKKPEAIAALARGYFNAS
ncbi:hypothetical protein [Lentibacillus saliphilus]|uniref:hypothetical protein n=1 Tax=Lentibacillus saliphilus TaxID=2737028 RepID=UPI001C30B18E|nr:hypothetical protein [Lentibacillus saliphilus]